MADFAAIPKKFKAVLHENQHSHLVKKTWDFVKHNWYSRHSFRNILHLHKIKKNWKNQWIQEKFWRNLRPYAHLMATNWLRNILMCHAIYCGTLRKVSISKYPQCVPIDDCLTLFSQGRGGGLTTPRLIFKHEWSICWFSLSIFK